MKSLLQYWFWSCVDFTERHFDSAWLVFVASMVVFAGLCIIFF